MEDKDKEARIIRKAQNSGIFLGFGFGLMGDAAMHFDSLKNVLGYTLSSAFFVVVGVVLFRRIQK